MIQQEALAKMVQAAIPELREELRDSGTGAYPIIKLLRQHTIAAAMRKNYNRVRQCMLLAEVLYNHGCTAIRSAVSNVYIYAVDTMLGTIDEPKRWKGLIPRGLYSLYLRQMFQSGL